MNNFFKNGSICARPGALRRRPARGIARIEFRPPAGFALVTCAPDRNARPGPVHFEGYSTRQLANVYSPWGDTTTAPDAVTVGGLTRKKNCEGAEVYLVMINERNRYLQE